VCTLATYVGCLAGWPLVVAANRDEFLSRPSKPPELLRATEPRAFGGRDVTAGGTWLGVSEFGLVAGVLNRRTGAPPDGARRSRGRLCLELLACRTAAEAAERIAAEPPARYNAYNLLAADAATAVVATQPQDGSTCLVTLPAGLHLLTNLDLNDPTCPRIAASHRRFADAGETFARDGDVEGFVARLQAILADHATALDPRGPGSLCVHADGFGTRSSSVLLLPAAGRPIRYFHADGPPCRVPLAPVALPF
jgi:uncharacterized protein with NRDE domain